MLRSIMVDTKNKLSAVTISVEEAGQLLGIARGTAYKAARNGDLPVVRVGKRYLVPRAALEQMLNEAGLKRKNSPGDRQR